MNCHDSQDICEVTGRKVQLGFGPSSGNQGSPPCKKAGVSEFKTSVYVNAYSLHASSANFLPEDYAEILEVRL